MNDEVHPLVHIRPVARSAIVDRSGCRFELSYELQQRRMIQILQRRGYRGIEVAVQLNYQIRRKRQNHQGFGYDFTCQIANVFLEWAGYYSEYGSNHSVQQF